MHPSRPPQICIAFVAAANPASLPSKDSPCGFLWLPAQPHLRLLRLWLLRRRLRGRLRRGGHLPRALLLRLLRCGAPLPAVRPGGAELPQVVRPRPAGAAVGRARGPRRPGHAQARLPHRAVALAAAPAASALCPAAAAAATAAGPLAAGPAAAAIAAATAAGPVPTVPSLPGAWLAPAICLAPLQRGQTQAEGGRFSSVAPLISAPCPSASALTLPCSARRCPSLSMLALSSVWLQPCRDDWN